VKNEVITFDDALPTLTYAAQHTGSMIYASQNL
jgi:hypothetical protein